MQTFHAKALTNLYAAPFCQGWNYDMILFMNRATVIAELETRASTLKGMGATALYVFGSVARNEAQPRDVDIFIEYEPESRFSLIELVGIKQYLEAELGTEVDLTTRDSLHPMLKAEIEQSAIRVY